MATKKPFSTISYNSEKFLINTFENLVDDGKILFYYAIKHFPEVDEEKEHYHIYVEPNKAIDFASFCKWFIEPVQGNKPLRCLPCRNSKTDDCLLYDMHDEDYLRSKMQVRKYHYQLSDFITNDEDYLQELYKKIDRKKLCTNSIFLESAENGVPFHDLVAQGYVPIHQIKNYETFYNALIENTTYRNCGTKHEEVFLTKKDYHKMKLSVLQEIRENLFSIDGKTLLFTAQELSDYCNDIMEQKMLELDRLKQL